MKARKLYHILLLLTLCVSAFAQHPQHRGFFDPKEFNERLEEFITTKARFTTEESQKFFPLYHEMRGKLWKLRQEMDELKKRCPSPETTEKEYSAIIMKIQSLNVQMANVQESYYKRMCKAVSPHKVYDAMKAEDKFHRTMLERFGNNKPKGKKLRK